MRKTPSLFKRDYEGTRLVYNEAVPGSEWVLLGEGTATIKWDGTSCMVKDGVLYKRYDAKHGKNPPAGAIPCDPAPDPVTGHWPHWVEVDFGAAENRWHTQAWRAVGEFLPDGTYELVGEKINGNAHRFEAYSAHEFWRHGNITAPDCPRTFDGIKAWLEIHEVEGIVFHHPDGRMVKVRRADFGFEWPVKP